MIRLHDEGGSHFWCKVCVYDSFVALRLATIFWLTFAQIGQPIHPWATATPSLPHRCTGRLSLFKKMIAWDSMARYLYFRTCTFATRMLLANLDHRLSWMVWSMIHRECLTWQTESHQWMWRQRPDNARTPQGWYIVCQIEKTWVLENVAIHSWRHRRIYSSPLTKIPRTLCPAAVAPAIMTPDQTKNTLLQFQTWT